MAKPKKRKRVKKMAVHLHTCQVCGREWNCVAKGHKDIKEAMCFQCSMSELRHGHHCQSCGRDWACVQQGHDGVAELMCPNCATPAVRQLGEAVAFIIKNAEPKQAVVVEEIMKISGRHVPRLVPPFNETAFRELCEKVSAEMGLPDLLDPHVKAFCRDVTMRYIEGHQQ